MLRLLALAIGIALLGGACAGAGASRTIEIRIHHSRFEPEQVTVRAGEPARFVLVNDDPIDHEWIVGDEALHHRHRTGTEPTHGDRSTEQSVAALGLVRTTVTFEQPGTYRYVCHLPGHEAYGMVGTIVVTGS